MAYFGGSVSERAWPRLDVRFLLLFGISLIGIISSIILGQKLLAANQHVDTPPVPAVIAAPKNAEVYVAMEDISAGKQLRPALFRLEMRPIDGIESDVLTKMESWDGIYARVNIAAKTPLVREAVSAVQPGVDITGEIPAGYRAVAIPVNDLSGVEGWVQPGVWVDVVWSTTHLGRMLTTTIVENAQVLSAERSMESNVKAGVGPSVTPSHISLLVTTQDAEKIQLAKNSGSLSLSLRGKDDTHSGGVGPLSAESLFRNAGAVPGKPEGKVTINGKDFLLLPNGLVAKEQFDKQQAAEEAKQGAALK